MDYARCKRLFDFTASVVLIVVFLPILLVLSLINIVAFGRPIIFKQRRPGMGGKPFELYKFRTMTNQKDRNGRLLPDHQRLTSWGHFLRKTSLDELPELFNVLKGDMSIVGPRPLLMKYIPYYTKREQKRHDVRPGLTGLSQVSGRNLLDWKTRLEKDVEYVENLSFVMDFKIVLKTISIVLQRENVELNAIDDLDVYRKGRNNAESQ